MTTIHEFTAPIWVQTPLGEGRALLMLDYGIDHNIVFLVQLDNGQFKCVDTNDCRGQENLMLGITKPVAPRNDDACIAHMKERAVRESIMGCALTEEQAKLFRTDESVTPKVT